MNWSEGKRRGKMNILSNFSETLSELMTRYNLNKKELAEKIGIDDTSIIKYLNSGVIPKLPYAIAIADYFSCSLDYLFGLTDDYKMKQYLPCLPFFQAFQSALDFNKCTKYRLAKVLKVSNQTTIAWGKGASIPSMSNLIKIANYFGCTLDELVGRKSAD